MTINLDKEQIYHSACRYYNEKFQQVADIIVGYNTSFDMNFLLISCHPLLNNYDF